MITDKGKNILSKYLIGQAPAYASYIAIGCGAKPLATSDTTTSTDYSLKQSLDLEMLRVPIISKGYVSQNVLNEYGDIVYDEAGNPEQYSDIVFTAELPSQERYEISEIGIYSAGKNPNATLNDSKTLLTFSNTEQWELHGEGLDSTIQTFYRRLDQGPNTVVEGRIDEADGNLVPQKAFWFNSDNQIFEIGQRKVRNERPRFLNSSLAIRGDLSTIGVAGPEASTPHVHLSGTLLSLDQNSLLDELRVGFSIINKNEDGETVDIPDSVKIVLRFASEDNVISSTPSATVTITVDSSELVDNRYIVRSIPLNDIQTTTNFTWSSVTVSQIYVDVEASVPSDFFVAMDAVRIENTTMDTPLYGMTGYAVVRTIDGLPIVKEDGKSNLVEFRFGMDVV